MERDSEICHACGAKIRSYIHSLNKPMVDALGKLYEVGESNLQDLDITKNQYNNFQKLQHFSLVERTGKDGVWRITDLGEEFVEGRGSINKRVETFRNKVVQLHSPLVRVSDVTDVEYRKRDDYVSDGNSMQGELF